MRVAFFGEAAFPSHNIKWINHLVNHFPLEAILVTHTGEDTAHIDPKVQVYKVLRVFPVLDKKRRSELTQQYEAILNEHEIELIHFLWGVDLVQWATVLKRKYVITTRGTDVLNVIPRQLTNVPFQLSTKFLHSKQKQRKHKQAYHQASWVTSTSKAQKESILRFEPRVKNHTLVRTGTYASIFLEHEIEVPKELRVILSPRSMRELYNQDIIIGAFASFLQSNPEAQLRMVDNYPNEPWSHKIRTQVKELGIENHVEFLEGLEHEQMAKEYKDADVCVMVPRSDGVPVSGIESMMAGCPLILGASDYDQEIFNDDTVWRLKETTAIALLQCLQQLNQEDSDLLSQKVKNAQRISLEYGATEHEMKKIYNIYEQILSENLK